jgi:hypothetical protein
MLPSSTPLPSFALRPLLTACAASVTHLRLAACATRGRACATVMFSQLVTRPARVALLRRAALHGTAAHSAHSAAAAAAPRPIRIVGVCGSLRCVRVSAPLQSACSVPPAAGA